MKKSDTVHLTDRLWKVCLLILTGLVLLVALYFTYYSLFYSYYSYYGTPLFIIKDSFKLNLCVLTAAALFVFLLEHWFEKLGALQERAGYFFLGVCCLLFLIAGFIWTSQLPYYPSGDQLSTTAAAAYSLEGNYSMWNAGGYIGIHSHQKGLVFLYEILFTLFGNFCYGVVGKLHVISGALTMIFGYLFLKEISGRIVYRLLCCLCILFCAPYIILMPYAYGDIPSICFASILFWAVQKYSRAYGKGYLVIACLSGILALFCRTNSWILLIAVGIGLCLSALEKRSVRPVMAAACILLSAAMSLQLLNVSYEIRSGIANTDGTPASLYLAMGMQIGYEGTPGTYNRFHQTTLAEVDFDREAADALGWEEVRDRLQYFRENPDYAVQFYTQKVQQQWLAPLFESLENVHSFPEDSAAFPHWIAQIYSGELGSVLFHIGNSHQCIIYAGLLFFAVGLRKQKGNSTFLIPLIAILGGFLFSIIWEAQCRYVFPYYLFLSVYAPIGWCSACDAVRSLLNRFRNRKQQVHAPDEQTDSRVA